MSTFDREGRRDRGQGRDRTDTAEAAPGRSPVTARLPASARSIASEIVGQMRGPAPVAHGPVQFKGGARAGANALDIAARGVGGTAAAFPYREQIETSFGRSLNATAHMDEAAAEACNELGAEAFATGTSVAFNNASPSLHTAAHEAAHVLQQAEGVHLKDGIGESGDTYEQAADRAADLVVSGQSAAHLFGGGSGAAGVQLKALQLKPGKAVQLVPHGQGAEQQAGRQQGGEGEQAGQEQQQQRNSPEAVQRFINKTAEASTALQVVTGRFSAWLSSMAIGYSNAWHSHQNALTAAGQAAKDANALVTSIVMAGLGSAASSLWGVAFTKLTERAPLVAGAMRDLGRLGGHGGEAGPLQEMAQTGVEHARDAATEVSAPGGFAAMPTNPVAWPNAMNVRVQTEVLTPARELILRWQHSANNDPNFDVSFDPVAGVRALAFERHHLISLAPADSARIQRHFERAFLHEWIQTEAFNVYRSLSQFSWGKAEDKIIQRGYAIGMGDVRTRLHTAVSAGVAENNRRALESGHGLI